MFVSPPCRNYGTDLAKIKKKIDSTLDYHTRYFLSPKNVWLMVIKQIHGYQGIYDNPNSRGRNRAVGNRIKTTLSTRIRGGETHLILRLHRELLLHKTTTHTNQHTQHKHTTQSSPQQQEQRFNTSTRQPHPIIVRHCSQCPS